MFLYNVDAIADRNRGPVSSIGGVPGDYHTWKGGPSDEIYLSEGDPVPFESGRYPERSCFRVFLPKNPYSASFDREKETEVLEEAP